MAAVMDRPFAEFVRTVIDRHFDGKHSKLAEAIDVGPSQVSRVAAGARGAVFSSETCLRLASVAGLRPSDVLRRAGKADVADLIEELYGHERVPMTAADRRFAGLPTAAKVHLLSALRVIQTQPAASVPSRHGSEIGSGLLSKEGHDANTPAGVLESENDQVSRQVLDLAVEIVAIIEGRGTGPETTSTPVKKAGRR